MPVPAADCASRFYEVMDDKCEHVRKVAESLAALAAVAPGGEVAEIPRAKSRITVVI